MTIDEIKQWLVERGHEKTVVELAKKRAKKANYVRAANAVSRKTAIKKKPKPSSYALPRGKARCKNGYQRDPEDAGKCLLKAEQKLRASGPAARTFAKELAANGASCPLPAAQVVPGLDKRWTWGAIAKGGAKAAAGLAAIVALGMLAYYYGLIPESAVQRVLGSSSYAESLKTALPALTKLLESSKGYVGWFGGKVAGAAAALGEAIPGKLGQACAVAVQFGKLVATYVSAFKSYLAQANLKQLTEAAKSAAAAGNVWLVRILEWIVQFKGLGTGGAIGFPTKTGLVLYRGPSV